MSTSDHGPQEGDQAKVIVPTQTKEEDREEALERIRGELGDVKVGFLILLMDEQKRVQSKVYSLERRVDERPSDEASSSRPRPTQLLAGMSID